MKKRKGSSGGFRPDGAAADESIDTPDDDPGTGSGFESAPTAGSEPRDLQVEPETISEEIREELRELDELRDRHLRLVAEFENYRKRTRRELAETRQAGQGDVAMALLEVLDDLSRFATTPVAQTTADALHEAVEMVNRKLRKKLEDLGLRDVEAGDGVVFDPAVHEALLTTHVDDPALDDRISRVFSPGYAFGERLLRPAQVEVQQHPGSGPAGASESGAGGGAGDEG